MDIICKWQLYAMKELICLLFKGNTSNVKCLYCRYREEYDD